MTTIHAIQAWCVLNIGIYVFAHHVFNYGRTAVEFLETILKTPEMVNNNPLVISTLRDINLPPFEQFFAYQGFTMNLIISSLLAGAFALIALPFIPEGVVYYVIVFLVAAISLNTLVIGAQLMHKRSTIKKICNHYYNIVESSRLDNERNKEAAVAFQQFADRLQELLNNPNKKEDGDNE